MEAAYPPSETLARALEYSEQPPRLAEICQKIWDLETQYGLFDHTVGGVHWWTILRVPIYTYLTQALGILDDAHPKKGEPPSSPSKPGASLRGRRTRRLQILLYELYLWRFRMYRNVDFVVFPHGRKVRVGGHLVDIYTDRLYRESPLKNFLTIDFPFREEFSQFSGPFVVRNDKLTTLARLRRRYKGWKPRGEEVESLNKFEKLFREEFGGNVPIAARAIDKVRIFLTERAVYGKVFDHIKPKHVFLAVSYFRTPVIAAAKERGIAVHEMQHGTIAPYHLGYSYPGRPHIPYAPDTLLCFGQFWVETTEFPGNTLPLVIGRTSVIDDMLQKKRPKKQKQIVILSQGALSGDLIRVAVQAAQLKPHLRFIFRLHPSEFKEDVLAKLSDARLEMPENITLSQHERSFYDLLAESDIQVGVFSTALFEGMLLDCRTILLNLPGVEWLKPVVDRGDAIMVETAEELVSRLEEAPRARSIDYYSKPVDSVLDLVGSK